jgi:hypothetical protein
MPPNTEVAVSIRAAEAYDCIVSGLCRADVC